MKQVLDVLLIGLLIAAAILALPRASTAQISVNQYRVLPERERTIYVTAVFDGWRFMFEQLWTRETRDKDGESARAPLEKHMEKYIECVGNMTREQIRAVVDKYVQANPEDWHTQAVANVFLALGAACKR